MLQWDEGYALAFARRMLEGILDQMPEEQRVVFSLFEFEGMTGDEIAELLGLSRKTIGHRLDRIREAVVRVAEASEPAEREEQKR